MGKILVTGSAGFIGFHTVKLLLGQGYDVISVDNLNEYYDRQLKEDRLKQIVSEHKFCTIDICDYEDMEEVFRKNKIECIVHLAAQAGVRYSLVDPFAYHKSNLWGTLNLLELCRKYKISKFVFASSSSVYGEGKGPFKETDTADRPISLYAATKRSGELMCHSYYHLYGINCFCLRFFTVYGPWGRPDMALFRFTKNILENKAIEVYNWGKMERDFTYVDDITSGIVASVAKVKGYEIINLGNSKPVKLMQFIRGLEHELGKKAKLKLMPMQPGDVTRTYADVRKARKLLGYKAKMNFPEGIREFVAWYKEYYKVKSN